MKEPLAISFILPVLNETFSLEETVNILFRVCPEHIHETLIVIADRTTADSMAVIDKIKDQHPQQIRVHKQSLPFLGGALQEAFGLCQGEYIMLMSSDLETNPELAPAFIEAMQEGSWDIVASSRWIKGGGFTGYNPAKWFLNYLFQTFFRILYWTKLTDLTFAYRLYRRDALQNIRWEELKHPFLLECLLKPLRRGAKVIEIPCSWQARPEGTSANSFLETFKYLRIAFKARFQPLSSINKGE